MYQCILNRNVTSALDMLIVCFKRWCKFFVVFFMSVTEIEIRMSVISCLFTRKKMWKYRFSSFCPLCKKNPTIRYVVMTNVFKMRYVTGEWLLLTFVFTDFTESLPLNTLLCPITSSDGCVGNPE